MANYTIKTLTRLNLTVAGTPQTIVGSATKVTRIWLTGDPANTGNMYVFENGKAREDGIVIDAGQTVELSLYQDSQDIDTMDLSLLRFDGDTTDEDLRVSYLET